MVREVCFAFVTSSAYSIFTESQCPEKKDAHLAKSSRLRQPLADELSLFWSELNNRATTAKLKCFTPPCQNREIHTLNSVSC